MNLGEHTLTSYDAQLKELSDSILSMGAEVRSMLAACTALLACRASDAHAVVASFERIRTMDAVVEERATIVLALQSPMAIDLRFVTSVLKITGMLERAGDLSKSCFERISKLGDRAPELGAPLSEMIARSDAMLGEALGAFAARDRERAALVCAQDAAVDALYHDAVRAYQKRMSEEPALVPAFSHAVFAAKNIERIADYTTNLAKTVYYIASGQRLNA